MSSEIQPNSACQVPDYHTSSLLQVSLPMEYKARSRIRWLSSRALVLLFAACQSLHMCQAFVSPSPPLLSKQRTATSRPPVECNLFFRSKRPTTRGSWKIPDAALDELSEATVTFPYHLSLESRDGEQESKEVIIRTLELYDLPDVIPMCVKEFGSGPAITSIDQIPWDDLMKDPSSRNDITDRILFAPLVETTLQMKIKRQQAGDDPSRPNVQPDDTILCVETDGKVVGIVDLSRQPPDPERNPPPVPLPMFIKNLLSTLRGLPSPDGWVSNLLVDESYRGQGYSKLLMKAVEGLARSWQCEAIYLHVDADSGSGRVPQELYRGLGYEPVIDKRSQRKYDWMGPELMNLGLYVIDEVPLLFLKKNLTDSL